MATYTTIPTFTAGQVLRANGDGSTYAGMNDLKNNLDLLNAQSAYPYRNLLYNGAMQIAQRGSSTASITTGNYYTADRWTLGISSHGTWTQSVENDAPTGTALRRSLKMLCTTANASPAAGNYLAVQQLLEGYDVQRILKGTSSAQTLTLSFWVKSNATGTYVAELADNDNSRSVSKTYTISASGTWEQKTITFPADTTGAFDNDNAASLTLNFWLGAGSTFTSGTLATTWASTTSANRVVGQTNLAAATSNYWQITGVQLEVGTVSTPFESLPYGDDLAKCQRYYWRMSGATGNNSGVAHGAANGGTSPGIRRMNVPLPVAMRTKPTAAVGGTHYLYTVGLGNRGFAGINSQFNQPDRLSLDLNTSTTTTAGEAIMWIIDSASASDYLEASAEL